MTTVLEISDSEEANDCVIESVIFLEDESKEKYSNLYYEVYKDNKLLAEFIEKCLTLENSKYMLQILKLQLLQHYYNADKTARESPKFQRNLRRANNLLVTNPRFRFTHIKDLCDILKALKVKKKVPFITLSTNLEGKSFDHSESYKPNVIKRTSTEQIGAGSSCSKKAKLDNDNLSPFSETVSCIINDTVDSLDDSILTDISSQQNSMAEDARKSIWKDGSICMDLCSQGSSVAEGTLLVEKKDISAEQVTHIQNRINAIENKISFYKKRIAILDELEVDDDSVNSPYIRSERLKSKIVSLYTELCQLKGSQPVKRRGIRLKVADGRPQGPTKVLEKFLNRNFNRDGDPPFPDFCDVVNCVTEANDKDDLGWTKAQIMKEASALFTMCGRALQKRRQNREYRDLIRRMKLEDFDKDPADDDPQLKALLEENKRIATKKESDILEKYTMMQNVPTKPNKSNTHIRNNKMESVNQANINTVKMHNVIIIDDSNSTKNPGLETLDNKQKDQCNGNKKHNIMHNSCQSSLNEGSWEHQDTTLSYINIEKLKDSVPNIVENTTKPILPQHNNIVDSLNDINVPHRNILQTDDLRHKMNSESGVNNIHNVDSNSNDNNYRKDVEETKKHKSISIENQIFKHDMIFNRSQKTVDIRSQDESFQKQSMQTSIHSRLDVLSKVNGDFTMSIEIIE